MGSATAAEARSFGKYTLIARLATGGMAEIFLARLSGAAGFEKLVCIKRILPHLARDKQFVAMFLDEARIAAQISHPNVCQVFELGELAGSYYIAMEYLEGVPLACFRRRDYYGAPPDPRLVAGIAMQACEGLHHAHQLRAADGTPLAVVHRDVSPQNLFVTVDGIVKVLDFGIAKVQDASVKTSTGAVKGTYAYMAPEQLRGERLDRRVDVWAMGITIWETLTRRHLFKRDTDFLTFQAITQDPIADVAELRPDVPPALAQVIARALARDPDGRFPTARALAEAVAEAVVPIGGALAPSAIGDEMAAAFGPALAEQATLIQAARSGRVLALDEDRGPMVGHGAELLTTPISTQRTPAPTGVSMVIVTEQAVERALGRADARTSARRIALVAIALVLLGAGALVVYETMRRESPDATIAAASGSAGSAAAGSAAAGSGSEPADAAIVASPMDAAVAADAAIAASPVDAAAAASPPDAAVGPPDAAVRATRPDNRPPRKRNRPRRPKRPRPPAGPPGYITIDSAPVYSVIYIDGKRHGETPLVKIELAPGRHVVRAVSPSGATRTITVKIEPGKVAPPRRISW